jgi:hypothetical protein
MMSMMLNELIDYVRRFSILFKWIESLKWSNISSAKATNLSAMTLVSQSTQAGDISKLDNLE